MWSSLHSFDCDQKLNKDIQGLTGDYIPKHWPDQSRSSFYEMIQLSPRLLIGDVSCCALLSVSHKTESLFTKLTCLNENCPPTVWLCQKEHPACKNNLLNHCTDHCTDNHWDTEQIVEMFTNVRTHLTSQQWFDLSQLDIVKLLHDRNAVCVWKILYG